MSLCTIAYKSPSQANLIYGVRSQDGITYSRRSKGPRQRWLEGSMQGPLVMLASFGCLVYEHVHLANSSGHTLKIYTNFHMCYTLVKIVLKSLK